MSTRLYLVDTARGESLLLAKAFSGGWGLWHNTETIDEFIGSRDFGAAYCDQMTTLTLMSESEYDAYCKFNEVIHHSPPRTP